ncbi:hypothetical protein HAX54_026167 [Datura stramonium]|uniref:Uncharacterized protein n=1 Tax=Datura stramonium TaxID=4076 RepID=A0ABS8S7R6_DATST|nr:hypothetical protein [Datura stramonium]
MRLPRPRNGSVTEIFSGYGYESVGPTPIIDVVQIMISSHNALFKLYLPGLDGESKAKAGMVKVHPEDEGAICITIKRKSPCAMKSIPMKTPSSYRDTDASRIYSFTGMTLS